MTRSALLLVLLLASRVHAQDNTAHTPIDGRALQHAIDRQREPTVADVVRAALRASAADPDEIASLRSRSRLGGLVPQLRLGARRGQGRDWNVLQSTAADRATIGTDDDLSIEGALSFSFDRLVYGPDEVPLSRQARELRAERLELARTVVRLYFERRRLLLERELLGPRGIDHAMAIDAISAELDVFTAGAFRSMLRRARERR